MDFPLVCKNTSPCLGEVTQKLAFHNLTKEFSPFCLCFKKLIKKLPFGLNFFGFNFYQRN